MNRIKVALSSLALAFCVAGVAPAMAITPVSGNQWQQRLTVCYDLNSTSCAPNEDVTEFSNIWGRTSASGKAMPFPGDQSTVFFKSFDKTKYVSAKIVVPSTGLTAANHGIFTHGGSNGGPNLTVAISELPGNFTPVNSQCLITNGNPESIVGAWKITPTSGGPSPIRNGCPLVPGHTYYLNIKATNPAAKNFSCNGVGGTGKLCTISVISNHTP